MIKAFPVFMHFSSPPHIEVECILNKVFPDLSRAATLTALQGFTETNSDHKAYSRGGAIKGVTGN